MHLARMLHLIGEVRADVAVVDPLSALRAGGSNAQSDIMVLRLIDFLKSAGTTALYLSVESSEYRTDLNISSLMDTWITLRNRRDECGLERGLYIVKSRGMAHSSHVCQMQIGSEGVRIAQRKAAP
jgi:circadian clock protein KaiC